MTVWSPTITPKEVCIFIDLLRCPVCGGKLDSEESVTLGYNGEFDTLSGCISNTDEYFITLHWEDPKKIEWEYETLKMWDEEKEYSISIVHGGGDPFTNISVTSLDECGSCIDDTCKIYSFSDHIFDFSKFNRDGFINKIKTLIIFR